MAVESYRFSPTMIIFPASFCTVFFIVFPIFNTWKLIP